MYGALHSNRLTRVLSPFAGALQYQRAIDILDWTLRALGAGLVGRTFSCR